MAGALNEESGAKEKPSTTHPKMPEMLVQIWILLFTTVWNVFEGDDN